jgi:hypothetical protein
MNVGVCKNARSAALRKTQLLFFEGLPGSGKSTMTHFIARQLERARVPHTWHYEVNAFYPLNPFHDMESFRQFHRLIEEKHFQTIFGIYLESWRQFMKQIQDTDQVFLLDGGLFGSLSWMLFLSGLPVMEFEEYLAQVVAVIRELDPCLIYLSQRDVLSSLRRWLTRSGGNIEQDAVGTITSSPYGKRHHLTGFDGLLQFWRDYQMLLFRAFTHSPFLKKEIENTAGYWRDAQQKIVDFLCLPLTDDLTLSPENLQRYVGIYDCSSSGEQCVVEMEHDALYLRGPAVVWQKNRLIPVTFSGTFEVESLPFTVSFVQNEKSCVEQLVMSGPEQLLHTVNHVYQKIERAEQKR